jgi:acyl-CoA synthetase (NDP forming)
MKAEPVAIREGRADVSSLRHVFRPDSVAVVGASRRQGTVGRSILHNIVSGGYAGRVYAVNPHTTRMEGVRCLPSVSTLPEPPELAVIAVPPAAVPAVADECGRRGVKAVVVITPGLDALQGADLLATCRRYGMRLVGPNCFGIAVPGIGLDATFAARHPAPGQVGLVVQSGGLGFALADRISRMGLGISSFASVGNKYDVSGNDLLAWWEQDGSTRLAVLYIESFGNPRKFVRTARRVSAAMPVLAVQAGRQSLFEQAGVIVTESLGELLEAAALLGSQPVPAGRDVAIISNVGGAGLLAADACTSCGLSVHKTSAETRRRLHALVPSGGAIAGPVDTTAAVPETSFRRCLELVAADEGVDAVLALVLPTAATGDLSTAVRAADVSVPLAVVELDQAEAVTLVARATDPGQTVATGEPRLVPCYASPEAAARALARAAGYGRWRSRLPGDVQELGGVREDDARGLAHAFLRGSPGGGWLPPGDAAELLGCYGIPLASPVPGGGLAPPAAEGDEVVIGVAQEPVFGPLVMFGLAGAGAGVPAEHGARLAPLTGTDADELIRSVPLPLGEHGALPEVAELELNPVVACPDGVTVVGARVRLAPAQHQDPFLRTLR